MDKPYTISKKRFLNWLISSPEDIALWGNKFIADLKMYNEIAVVTEELFEERESLPGHLFERQLMDKDRHLVDGDISISLIRLLP